MKWNDGLGQKMRITHNLGSTSITILSGFKI
jgi:hypothetical protein